MDLSKKNFNSIRYIIKGKSGIWLGDTKINFLESRLTRRFKATSMETVKDYYYYLKYDSDGEKELEALIDAVTINETCFFREKDQLDDFIDVIFPRLLDRAKASGPLTIWSAGCSTGEEPYTLAMLLMEHFGVGRDYRINILASDISRTVLHSAREGIYDDYSIRYVPNHYLAKYFDKIGEGKYAIKALIKQMVSFARINLMNSFATGRIRNMDCIFCRNVIIYFDDEDKEICMDHLYRSFNKEGYLFLGHSESMNRISNLFEVVRLNQTLAYRKPG